MFRSLTAVTSPYFLLMWSSVTPAISRFSFPPSLGRCKGVLTRAEIDSSTNRIAAYERRCHVFDGLSCGRPRPLIAVVQVAVYAGANDGQATASARGRRNGLWQFALRRRGRYLAGRREEGGCFLGVGPLAGAPFFRDRAVCQVPRK